MENLFLGNEYANEKLNRGLKILKEQYFKSSFIEKIVTVKDAKEGKDFVRFGFRHLIPKEWFTSKTHYIDLVFQQFAGNLAFSEYKFIVDKIFEDEAFPKVDITGNTPTSLVENFKTFSKTNRPDVLLAPIDFYVDMHTEWYKTVPDFQVNFATGEILIAESKQTIFWSNKYVPFDGFVLLDKRFSEMIFKPSFSERLVVEITHSEKSDMLDLSFSTILKFAIVDTSKILVLHAKKTNE